jgi:hypothetical protein
MNTIQQTVHIPADRRLRLDLILPEDIPEGQAEMMVILSPTAYAISESAERMTFVSTGLNRLDFMRGQCIVPEDIKAVGREEIIAMFEETE